MFFRKNKIIKILLLIILVFIFSKHTYAAGLFFDVGSSKVSLGNILTIKVYVNTEGKAINNTDVKINYPSDLLEVISLSKSTSIFNLWVEEPQFQNSLGQITFNGGIPNPGYLGTRGEIISIVFKTKKVGNATIVFTDAVVRENNGLGTDILTSKPPLVIEISPTLLTEPIVPVTPLSLSQTKPIINSNTHPDSKKWYALNEANFNWSVPGDVTSIQTLLDKNPNSTPTVTYDGTVSQKTVKEINDGISYFHIRFMDNKGWGLITHYKIQIDTIPPELSMEVLNEGPHTILSIISKDSLSGLDYYLAKIDGKENIEIRQTELTQGRFKLPIQTAGEHTLVLSAYDKAGNSTETSVGFISPQITPPEITISKDFIGRNDSLIISGASQYPNTNVEIYVITSDGKKTVYTTTTDLNGRFEYKTEGINVSGRGEVLAKLVFSSDVISPLSQVKVIDIKDGPVTKISKDLIYTLSFVVPALILFFGLIFTLYLGWHKFFGLKRKLNKDLQSTAGDIHKSLMLYKEELEFQLNKLIKVKEDKELNKKEEKIFKELQKNLDKIDEFIEKKIRKII